jgi:glycosyltransferase involved in cell wall biosynthesis
MKQPLVSFVIPVLNGEQDIARCLNAIRSQSFASDQYEVLIVDNGSTDRTQQIVRNLGFHVDVIPGVTVSALRNRAAKSARGAYVAFVDADVELAPDWLLNGLASFKHQTVTASGGPRCIPQRATWVQRAWGMHLESRRPKAQPKPVPWLYSMAFIVCRGAFQAVGGFNECLETAEDVDLCYRLGQRGTILYNPAMKAVHWGEDPDLATFWNKEVWRGKGGLKGVLGHGLRWDELPSIGYPIYILCFMLLLTLSTVLDLLNQKFTLTLFSFGLLILPALLLAIATIRRTGQPNAFPGVFLLYLVYGFARAYSMVSAGVHRHR